VRFHYTMSATNFTSNISIKLIKLLDGTLVEAIFVLRKGSMAGQVIGYARGSTNEQELYLQVDALKKAGCYLVLTVT
jgi:hypothetical protein